MNDHELFFLFIQYVIQVTTLTLDYNLPNGKPLPPHYEDLYYQLYKILESGVLEEWSIEQPQQEIPVQTDLFSAITSVEGAEKQDGTLIDPTKSKEKT